MIKDILWWGVWLLPLAYFVFRFRRQYWIVLVWTVVFILGFRFGLEWVDWIRTKGTKDWILLLDETPIGASTFRYFCAVLFGLAAIRVVERFLLPFFTPPSPPTQLPPQMNRS